MPYSYPNLYRDVIRMIYEERHHVGITCITYRTVAVEPEEKKDSLGYMVQ